MFCESLDVVRFDLETLVQGWPNLKVPISSLLLLPEVWDVKLTLNSTFLLPAGDHTTAVVLL